MESGKGSEAVNAALTVFRLAIFLFVSAASVATAWAYGLGYVWAGAWLKAPAIAAAATYLPTYFALAWVLVPFSRRSSVMLLWCLAAIAFAVWSFASLRPDAFPMKVTAIDLGVLAALPLSAYVYRHLASWQRHVAR